MFIFQHPLFAAEGKGGASMKDEILDVMGESDDVEEEDETSPPENEEEEEIEESDDEDEGDEEDQEDDPDGSGKRAKEPSAPVKVKADKKGNLVGPDGKIVAAAGPARRFYEGMINAQKESVQLKEMNRKQQLLMGKAAEAMREMKADLIANEKNKGMAGELGLEPSEAAEALQVWSKFKSNSTALEAVKFMLTRAVQRGIDIKSLGVGGGIDQGVVLGDIDKKITEALKPITQRFQQTDQQSERLAKLKEERETFTLQNNVPDQYVAILDQMKQQPQFQHLSYESAWTVLQNHLLRKALEAKSSQRESPGSRRSRPNGKGRVVNDRNRDGSPDDTPVGVDTSFRDIVKGVLEDYGPLDS